MRVLLLHPEDELPPERAGRNWDLIVDLGRAPVATYERWPRRRAAVSSACTISAKTLKICIGSGSYSSSDWAGGWTVRESTGGMCSRS